MPKDRIYPLAKPEGHKPPVQRWRLVYPDALNVHTAYVGIQRHEDAASSRDVFRTAVAAVESWIKSISSLDRSRSTETFRFLDGDDTPNTMVFVCYWENVADYQEDLRQLSLMDIYAKAPHIGIWCERFTTPIMRLETNYSGIDYLPGLARLSKGTPTEHTLTAYWGAARDRIPSSGHDAFAPERSERTRCPHKPPRGLGQRLFGYNPYDNFVHIRSGQFWEGCDAMEAEAYEKMLEPALKTGLKYLLDNREESGALGLRFLQNVRDGEPLKETCAAGFFRNLEDLEQWAKQHPSHLAIFKGAMKHAKIFGDNRKMRTWHEVSVLKQGEAHFEYINCSPNTGVISYIDLMGEDI
ncbi:hem-containing dehydratase protein [Aspergillus ambiguus]|uniref:phenylacetaldoxime dehydratase family protein n=1 Tax=Aspergillus ambiguus TaxID=176160 RepID=UPI003CCD0C0B